MDPLIPKLPTLLTTWFPWFLGPTPCFWIFPLFDQMTPKYEVCWYSLLGLGSNSSSIGIYWREISQDFVSSWDLTTPLPPQENFSPSRGILKMARVSPHFSSSRGIPWDGEMFSWRGWGMVRTFQNGESFSPFLLISWDSVRFVQTLPPPREVLSISWDLQTKSINRPVTRISLVGRIIPIIGWSITPWYP